MESETLQQNVIEFHLADKLKQMEELSKRGISEIQLFDLNLEQVRLLKKLGYRVDVFSYNHNPTRQSCNVYWT